MLVHVSAGYLPVRGWLHTCYSPVRRSPPGYCYPVLPLDLHVLSLSLAFILSQDQTLHGKSYFTEIFSGRVMCMNLDSRRFSDSRSLRFVHLNILKNSSFIFSRSRSSLPAPPLESSCKGKACFSISKFFQAFFQTFFPAPRFNLFPLAPSLSKAGAKIRQSFPFFQIF